ncbi:unnamed protein product [Periconia digitata]|uniref:Uncharacterized protein n=1 Tax=Periconia digitata TaxID=1303443 RepID=A0A9W4UF91_9PLEO|nr:unnamed protein product [Periconia digitata]
MQFFKQILLFTSAVSAVSIALYESAGQCTGNNVVCSNVNADTCCFVNSGNARGAIYFTNLPNPALVRTYGRGEGCANQIRSDRTTSLNWCVFNLANSITGGRWAFTSKRRAIGEQKNSDCVRPDTGYVQGRQFNLTGLDDKAFEDFLVYMKSVEPAVPEQFLNVEVVSSEGSAKAIE